MTQYVIDNFRGVNKVILKKEIEQYQQHYEEYIKKNEKLIEESKKKENKEYFANLDNNKKKLISLQSDYKYDDEESTIDDEINKIINRYSNFQKKVMHKHLNEFLREN